MSPRRVVITGIGAITPIGCNAQQFFEALVTGHSGVGAITQFDASRCGVSRAAEVKNFDPAGFGLSRRDVNALQLSDSSSLRWLLQKWRSLMLDWIYNGRRSAETRRARAGSAVTEFLFV
jgi:3-oxoacyl-(acyl-carrier-protein) synthase